MKLFGRLSRCAAVLAMAGATTLFAANEQWLTYHTGREGRGYRYLDLTTNQPPNVALPKLEGQAYFAQWVSPLDQAGGRWICFDRTKKTGPCNRLFFDSNGNGRLDDDKPVTADSTDESSAYFDPVRVVFKGEDGPITYHLIFRFMQYRDEDPRLLVSSGGWYEGMVNLSGKKRRLELIDGNVNGTFNDRSADSTESDRILLDEDRAGDRYLGRWVEADNEQLYRIEVARDGAFIKLQKEENAVFGKVRVPEAISQLSVFGTNGYFSRKPVKGEFLLPVGSYHLLDYTLERKDAKGVSWQLRGYRMEKHFEVTAQTPATLALGEPLRATFTARETTNDMVFDLELLGQMNETVQMLRNNERPRGPKLSLASADGAYVFTNYFQFG